MIIDSSNNLRENDDCKNINYAEAAAIQQLLAVVTKLAESEEAVDNEQIKITVGNETVAFTFGGPQIEGLCQFCEQLARENGYDIDFDSITVDCDDFWLAYTNYIY